jgi:hypothetical protein
VREIEIRFSSDYADEERVASIARRVYGSALTSYTLIMDSDEEMPLVDSEPPSLPSIAKGKGKALNDDLEDPAAGRDDTLPWYMEFLSRSR